MLEDLLERFAQAMPEVTFLSGWSGERASRRVERPTVAGSVEAEVRRPGSREVRLGFGIYLPQGTDARRGQAIFAGMCDAACGEPGFSAVSRGAVQADRTTGCGVLACTVSLVEAVAGDDLLPGAGVELTLGGRQVQAGAVRETAGFEGKELVSVGEQVPFGWLGAGPRYTVELEGFLPEGLEGLVDFTVRLAGGPAREYRHCRWKTLQYAAKRAVFVACERVEA